MLSSCPQLFAESDTALLTQRHLPTTRALFDNVLPKNTRSETQIFYLLEKG